MEEEILDDKLPLDYNENKNIVLNDKDYAILSDLMHNASVYDILKNETFKKFAHDLKNGLDLKHQTKKVYTLEDPEYKKVLQDYDIDKLDYYDKFSNVDGIKLGIEKINAKYYYGGQISKIFNEFEDHNNPYISRDTALYFESLDDSYSFEEKVAKTIRYVGAITKRDKSENHSDVSELYPIALELMNSFNEPYEIDLNSEEGIVKYSQKNSQFVCINQLYDPKKDFYDYFIKNNPQTFYKAEINAEYLSYGGKDLVFDLLAKVKTLPMVGSFFNTTIAKAYYSYSNTEKYKKVIDTTSHVMRNYTEFSRILFEASRTNKNVFNFESDLTAYAAFGLDTKCNSPLKKMSVDKILHSKNSAINASIDTFKLVMERMIPIYFGNKIISDVITDIKFFQECLYIQGKSLKELTDKYVLDKGIADKDVARVESAILIEAFNNPNKVISLSLFQPTDKGIETKAVVIKKNYNTLLERSKDRSRSFFEKLKDHYIYKDKTYEQRLIDSQETAINKFLKTNTLKNIESSMMQKYNEPLKKYNEPAQKFYHTYMRQKEALNDIRIQKERQNVIVNELNKNKSLLEKNDKEIEELLKTVDLKNIHINDEFNNIENLNDNIDNSIDSGSIEGMNEKDLGI